MTTIKYIGSADNYSELPVTGNQSLWQIGQQEERPDAEAGLLLATGLFSSPAHPAMITIDPVTKGIETKVRDVSLGFAKKRTMYPVNLLDPRLTGGYVTTLGTASEVAATSESGHSVVTCTATSAGSTARILKGWSTLTLDTAKYYELSCTPTAVTLGNRAAMGQVWFGIVTAPTEGSQGLNISSAPPVVGQRAVIRFRPSAASTIIRVGLGINLAETVMVGDKIVATDFALYEIPSLTSVVEDYSYNAFGVCGKAQTSPTPSPSSCVWAIGDSWTNDATDWAQMLGLAYGREMRVTAQAGDTLAVMKSRADTAAALGYAWLLNPGKNIPGVAVIIGGINDVIADASVTTIISRAQTMIDYVRARNMIPIFVLQPYASDSNHYTVGRMAIRTAFANYIKQEGCDYFDLAEEGFLTSGAANATYLLSESLNWIHPTTAGIALLTGLIERRLRDIDRACVVLNSPVWPKI